MAGQPKRRAGDNVPSSEPKRRKRASKQHPVTPDLHDIDNPSEAEEGNGLDGEDVFDAGGPAGGAPATPDPENETPSLSKKKKTHPYPTEGSRLLYVMCDVEFTHPIKHFGEIFQVAARPFLVEKSPKKSKDDTNVKSISETLFCEWVQPSLKFGDNEFYWAVQQVCPHIVLSHHGVAGHLRPLVPQIPRKSFRGAKPCPR